MSFVVLELSFLNIERLSAVDLSNRVLRVCRVAYNEGSPEHLVPEHQRTRPRCRIADEELRSLSLTNELISKYIDYADFIYSAVSALSTRENRNTYALHQKPLLLAATVDTYHALITEVSLPKSPLYKFPILFLSNTIIMNVTRLALPSNVQCPLNSQLAALSTPLTLHTVNAQDTIMHVNVMSTKQYEKVAKKERESETVEPSLKQSIVLSQPSSLVQSTSSSITRSQPSMTLKAIDGTIDILKILLTSYRESFERYLCFYMFHGLDIPKYETVESPLILRIEADRYITQDYLAQHCPNIRALKIRHSLHGLSFLLFGSTADLERGMIYFSDQFTSSHPSKTQLSTQAVGATQSPSYLVNFFDNVSIPTNITQYVPPMQVSVWPASPEATIYPNVMASDLTPSIHSILQQRKNKEPYTGTQPIILNKFAMEIIPSSVTNLMSNIPSQEKKEDIYRVSLQTHVNVVYPFFIESGGTVPNDPVYQHLSKSKHQFNCVYFTAAQALTLLKYGVIHIPKEADYPPHSPYTPHGASYNTYSSYNNYQGHGSYGTYSTSSAAQSAAPGRPEPDIHYYTPNHRKPRGYSPWNTSPGAGPYTPGETGPSMRQSRHGYGGQSTREYIMPHSNEVVCIRLKGANNAQAKDLNSFLASLRLLDLLAWDKYCVLSRSKGPIIRSSAKGFGNDNFWLLVCSTKEDAVRVSDAINEKKFLSYTLRCEISTENVDISDAQRSIACFIPDHLPNPCTIVSLKKLRLPELKRNIDSRSISPPLTYQESQKGIALFYEDHEAAERAASFYRIRLGSSECMVFSLPPSW